jgi:uncharacterized Rmd1/YagE family protein
MQICLLVLLAAGSHRADGYHAGPLGSLAPPRLTLRSARMETSAEVSITYSDTAGLNRAKARRSAVRLVPDETAVRRMSAYCDFASVNLEDAVALLERGVGWGGFGPRIDAKVYDDALAIRFSGAVSVVNQPGPLPSRAGGSDVKDAFIFPYGACCLWGFSESEELAVLRLLENCALPSEQPAEPAAAAAPKRGATWPHVASSRGRAAAGGAAAGAESELMLFVPGGEGTGGPAGGGGAAARTSPIVNDVIRLSTEDPEERLAVSFAFAQSVKLSVLEASLDELKDVVRSIPEALSQTGRCRDMSAKRIAQLTGSVFLKRNEANL